MTHVATSKKNKTSKQVVHCARCFSLHKHVVFIHLAESELILNTHGVRFVEVPGRF